MNIRPINVSDISKLEEIHDKYYKNEYPIKDFYDHNLCTIVVEDNEIITAAAVKLIPEIVAVTNKEFSVRKRREALYQSLSALSFLSRRAGYTQLHAFIQDKEWLKHLEKAGFIRCKGTALYLSIERD